MITEDQFRQALADIVAGISNPRLIIPQILIVATFFLQRLNPMTVGLENGALGAASSGIAIDCGVEFRAFCDAIDCPCDDLGVAPVTTESTNLAAGGIGAVIAIALAKRVLSQLAEKIEDPNVKSAILALLNLLG